MLKTFRGFEKKRVILNERLKLGDRSVTFCWFFKVLHPTALLDTGTYLPLEILSQVCSACAKTEKGAVGDTRSFFTKRTCRPKKNKLWIRRYLRKIVANIKMRRSETSKRLQNVLVVCSGLKIFLLGDDCFEKTHQSIWNLGGSKNLTSTTLRWFGGFFFWTPSVPMFWREGQLCF